MSSKSDSTNRNDLLPKPNDCKTGGTLKDAEKTNIKINNGVDDKKTSSLSSTTTKLVGNTNAPAVVSKPTTDSKDISDKKSSTNSNNFSNKSTPANSTAYKRAPQSTNAEKATDSDSLINPNVASISSSTGENSSSLTASRSHSSYSGSNSHRNSRRLVGQGTDFPANSDGHMGSSGGNLSRTNLYIRGLSPTTTDEDLFNMCAKFGNIVSTKAIQDKASGSCKGYGFVLFSAPQSAEMAVVELTKTGVQAQMARVPTHHEPPSKHYSYQNSNNNSHFHHHQYPHNNQNNQHQGNHGNNNHNAGSLNMVNNHSHNQSANHGNIADPTNLYLANLPPNMEEAELEALLANYGPVVSTRILRDEGYNPRGVGFARMESRDKCQEIIEKLNGKPYKGSREPLLVKFADGGNRKRHHNNNHHHHHHHHNNSHHKSNNEDGRWREGGDAVDPNVSQSNYEHQRNVTHGNHMTDISMMGGPMSYPRIQSTFPPIATNGPYPTALGSSTSTAQWIHPGSGQPWNVIPQMIQPNNLGPSSQAAVPANYSFGPHIPQLTSQMQGLQLAHHSGGPMSGYMPQWSPMPWSHPMPPPQQNPSQSVRSAAQMQSSPAPQQQQQQQQQQQIPQVITGATQTFADVQEMTQTAPSKQPNSSDTDKQIHAPL